MYRLRGPIERLCTQGHSVFHLHGRTGTRPERIQGLLSGRLLTMTMLLRGCAYAAWYAATVCPRASRCPKRILWLTRQGRCASAIQPATLETLYADLRRDMAALLGKPKRKRTTSHPGLAAQGHPRTKSVQEERIPVDQAA